MSEEANNLRQLFGFVESRLSLLPPVVSTDWDSYTRRRHAAEEFGRTLITHERARIVFDGQAPSIVMAGIRSSSTIGFEGALRNWLVAARKKLAAMEGVGS